MTRGFKKSPIRFAFVAAASLGFSAEASATHCYGTIKALYVSASGNVLVLPSFRNDWIQICSSQSAWNGIDPGTCKIWTALATTLRVTGDQAVIFYPSDSVACDAIPSYGDAPAPGYFMYYVQ